MVGIDDVSGVPGARLVRAVVDEDGQVDADLRCGQSDALGDGQRGEHVVDQAGERVVELGHWTARLVQHRVADHPDLGDLSSHSDKGRGG